MHPARQVTLATLTTWPQGVSVLRPYACPSESPKKACHTSSPMGPSENSVIPEGPSPTLLSHSSPSTHFLTRLFLGVPAVYQ